MTLFTETRGTGKDLVLLHGWGLNSGVWEPVSHYLTPHFRLTLIDLPGYGRNAETFPCFYNLQSVAELVSDHIPQGSIVMGWSMGGLVALQIALLRSDLLNQLIMVASAPCFPSRDTWQGLERKLLALFEKQLEQDFSKTLDRFLAIQALGSESARTDIKTIRTHVQSYPLPDANALQAGLAILADTDLREQVAQLQVPITRIYGRLDSLVPFKNMAVADALFGDQGHVIEHASHAPFISHADEFAEYLINRFAG